jgi:hypothetical protein
MKRSKPIDQFRTELSAALGDALNAKTDSRRAMIADAVAKVTEGWSVKRNTDYLRDSQGLVNGANVHREVDGDAVEGAYFDIRTTWTPLEAQEVAERAEIVAARRWAFEASFYDDDQIDQVDELGPPPARVGISDLLKQSHWWRARIQSDNPATEPIRLADMTHSHRLALLDFLRRRAEQLKLREDWSYASTSGPSGDMARDAFEAECERQWDTPDVEWLEDQPLVRALVRWTTPWGESPLTWQPMESAPSDREIVVRHPLSEDEEIHLQFVYQEWCRIHDNGSLSLPPLWFAKSGVEWRELRPEEGQRLASPAHEAGICDPDDCTECEPH